MNPKEVILYDTKKINFEHTNRASRIFRAEKYKPK